MKAGGNSSFVGRFDIFQGQNPTSNPGLLWSHCRGPVCSKGTFKSERYIAARLRLNTTIQPWPPAATHIAICPPHSTMCWHEATPVLAPGAPGGGCRAGECHGVYFLITLSEPGPGWRQGGAWKAASVVTQLCSVSTISPVVVAPSAQPGHNSVSQCRGKVVTLQTLTRGHNNNIKYTRNTSHILLYGYSFIYNLNLNI